MSVCPICNNVLEETKYFNKILEKYNYYCPTCESYHIIEEVNVEDYYATEYHQKFNYASLLPKLVNQLGLASNRTACRFSYLKNSNILNKAYHFLEIGGTHGEFYNIARKKVKPLSYTIVEPNPKFNRKGGKLFYINKVFEKIEINEIQKSDVIQMFHVFEHIFDINDFLEKLKNIKPAYFYFEIPNCSNKKVLEESLLNNPHYHHFSKKSIEILFQKHAYKKITLDEVEPISYHPYQKIGSFKRYHRRFSNKNYLIKDNGIYLRGIYEI